MSEGRFSNGVLILVVAAAVSLLQFAGYLQSVENQWVDAETRLLERPVPSDIVTIGIDARTVSELNQWPWPRRYHALFLEKIRSAEPASVFLDIDFSAQSNSRDDEALASELGRWPQGKIGLPIFFQERSGSDGREIVTRPLPEFSSRAKLGAVNQTVSHDGLVRTFKESWRIGDEAFPSAAALIAARSSSSESEHRIDYTIDPASFGYLSYVDILNDDFDRVQLKGKRVIVGAMARELNDVVPVPLHTSLPGFVVLATSAQTMLSGSHTSIAPWLLFAMIISVSILSVSVLANCPWRRGLIGTVAGSAGLSAAAFVVYARFQVLVPVVPLTLAAALSFAVTALRSLDRETVRSVLLAMGLRKRDALMESVVQSSSDCILCVDQLGVIRTANHATTELFEVDSQSLIGARVVDFLSALESPTVLAAHGSGLTECELRTAAGRLLPVEVSVCRVNLVEEELYTFIARDISDRKAQQKKLEHQARYDSLTNLPNRAAFNEYLERALSKSQPARPVALMMLDLCRFKEVNDTLGHNVGDTVLRDVADRFRTIVGDRAFLARIGGDEFIVLIDRDRDRDLDERSIEEMSARLAEGMRTPIKASGIELDIGLSIGVALYPQHAHDSQSLLRHADVAMYIAKRRGVTCERYDPKYDEHTVQRLSMIGELRRAIADGDLELFYQPQVNLKTRRAESAEALLRWRHEKLGNVRPAEFIAVAESTDLIQPLTEWTLRAALTQIRTWQSDGVGIRVAVNLSPRMLQDVRFPDQLGRLLAEYSVLPSQLELEITESAMMLDPSRALRVVNEIHAIGVIVSVDDYGTGFSSLSYLRDLPLHALKLDKSFVTQARDRADDRTIIASTVQLAHALKLQVVAEGVESAWHEEFLTAMGYDFAQGYHFGRAMTGVALSRWLQTFNAQTTVPVGSGASSRTDAQAAPLIGAA